MRNGSAGFDCVLRVPTLCRHLLEPFSGYQVLQQHDPPATFENHLHISPHNRHPPPFIIDPPRLTDRLNTFTISRFPCNDNRHSPFIQLDLNPLLNIEGS